MVQLGRRNEGTERDRRHRAHHDNEIFARRRGMTEASKVAAEKKPGGEAPQGRSTARDTAGRRDAEKKEEDDGCAAEDLGDND